MDQTRLEDILERLKRLEERIALIESGLSRGMPEKPDREDVQRILAPSKQDVEDRLEIQIGQNWFAKVGIVVLTAGVVFLLTFPYRNLPPIVPSILGYILAIGILAISRLWRESFAQLSRYLLGGGLLLLYFTTLRLAHFSAQPTVDNSEIEFVLLLAVVAFNIVVSLRASSVSMLVLNLALGYLTALMYGQAYVVFGIVTLLSALSVYIQLRFTQNAVTLPCIVLSYLTHALWAVNNPLFGNELKLVASPEANLIFVLIYSLIFAGGTFVHTKGAGEQPAEIFGAFLNGMGSYALFLLLTLTAYPEHVFLWQLPASILYLVFAIMFWIRHRARYSTFVYAMLGYGALSVAIIARSTLPEYFVWLCWQSVLVLSTAVWFRSQFIVVGNFIVYLSLFAAYLFTTGEVSVVSMSFGFVALISARILNWQKHRLELKTELMRNAYLACALFVIPYALYHSLPAGYVSLSWLVVALLYYLISRYLHNRKYRWMALLTTLLTIFYVIFVDLVGVDPAVRIVSFLVLGCALLAISMFYSRRRTRTTQGSAGKELSD